MNDESDGNTCCSRHGAGTAGRTSRGRGAEEESDEESCAAFGYLRGIRDQALAVEFRFQDGNSEWFPTACWARGGTTLRSGCC